MAGLLRPQSPTVNRALAVAFLLWTVRFDCQSFVPSPVAFGSPFGSGDDLDDDHDERFDDPARICPD